MIRVYKQMCRENPTGSPFGMRIITVHMEHLGRFIGSEWKTENIVFSEPGGAKLMSGAALTPGARQWLLTHIVTAGC